MNFLKREGINLATIFLNDLDRSRSGSRVFSRSRDIEWLSTTFTPCGSFWMWFFEQLRSSWQDFNCEMFVPQNRNDPELSEANFHAFSAKLLRTQLRSVTDGASRRVIGWHYTSVTLVSWSQISSEFFIFQHDSSGAQGAWQSTFPDNFSKCWAILKFFQNRPRVVK